MKKNIRLSKRYKFPFIHFLNEWDREDPVRPLTILMMTKEQKKVYAAVYVHGALEWKHERYTLKWLLKHLPPDCFAELNKSCVVNVLRFISYNRRKKNARFRDDIYLPVKGCVSPFVVKLLKKLQGFLRGPVA